MTGRSGWRRWLGLVRRAGLRTVRIVSFIAYFTLDFLKSNLIVLREILTPGSGVTPAIIKIYLESRTIREFVSIANLVTLTPGTLAVEVAVDPPVLYVHGMFTSDPEAFTAHILDLERRMLLAFRPVDAPGSPAPTNRTDPTNRTSGPGEAVRR